MGTSNNELEKKLGHFINNRSDTARGLEPSAWLAERIAVAIERPSFLTGGTPARNNS
jgi:hypothetical protein